MQRWRGSPPPLLHFALFQPIPPQPPQLVRQVLPQPHPLNTLGDRVYTPYCQSNPFPARDGPRRGLKILQTCAIFRTIAQEPPCLRPEGHGALLWKRQRKQEAQFQMICQVSAALPRAGHTGRQDVPVFCSSQQVQLGKNTACFSGGVCQMSLPQARPPVSYDNVSILELLYFHLLSGVFSLANAQKWTWQIVQNAGPDFADCPKIGFSGKMRLISSPDGARMQSFTWKRFHLWNAIHKPCTNSSRRKRRMKKRRFVHYRGCTSPLRRSL